jgi:hypothetical protein
VRAAGEEAEAETLERHWQRFLAGETLTYEPEERRGV